MKFIDQSNSMSAVQDLNIYWAITQAVTMKQIGEASRELRTPNQAEHIGFSISMKLEDFKIYEDT